MAVPEDLHLALTNNDVETAARVLIGWCLHSEDYAAAETACLALATHTDATLRGNAVLGLGHLARLHRSTSPVAIAAVTNALDDPARYVRSQAHAAADDLNHFTAATIAIGADDI